MIDFWVFVKRTLYSDKYFSLFMTRRASLSTINQVDPVLSYGMMFSIQESGIFALKRAINDHILTFPL